MENVKAGADGAAGTIQSWIVEPEVMTGEKPAQAAPKKASIRIEPELENGTDFVLTRKNSKGKPMKYLAVIMSQDQSYIKSPDGRMEPLTEKNVSAFFNGCDPVELKNTYWIDRMEKGIDFARSFINFLHHTPTSKLVKEGLMTYDFYRSAFRYNAGGVDGLSREPEKKLIKYAMSKGEETLGLSRKELFAYTLSITGYTDAVKGFLEHHITLMQWLGLVSRQYGIDRAKKMIDAFAERDLTIALPEMTYIDLLAVIDPEVERLSGRRASTYQRRSMAYRGGGRFLGGQTSDFLEVEKYLEETNFKHNSVCLEFDSMLEYMLSFQHEGYSTLDQFVNCWKDTLILQKRVYGKVVDRYPENLSSAHDRILVRAAENQRIQDISGFEEAHTDGVFLEWKTPGYVFIVPETPADVVSEATQQNNCLIKCGYVQQVARGRKWLVFMRKASDPDESLITIEVYRTGQIGQVLGKRNRRPTEEERQIVHMWAEEKGLVHSL